jgi:hypothetical protein
MKYSQTATKKPPQPVMLVMLSEVLNLGSSYNITSQKENV